MNWADAKTTAISYNVGWYNTHRLRSYGDNAVSSRGLGSGIQFDISPFYPFHQFATKITSSLSTVSNKVSSSSSTDSENSIVDSDLKSVNQSIRLEFRNISDANTTLQNTEFVSAAETALAKQQLVSR